MAEITRILAANIHRQFFFVINTTASTHCLVENFQVICRFAASECHITIQRQCQFKMFKMAERLDDCSGKTLLAPCTNTGNIVLMISNPYGTVHHMSMC